MIGRVFYKFLSRITPSDQFWQLLDSTGIICFVGPNGSGKSLCAVAAALETLDGRTWTCYEAMHRHHEPFRRHAENCSTCPQPVHVARMHKRLKALPPDHFCPRGVEVLEACATGERLVYSTVVLIDDEGDDHPRFRPLVDYRQLLMIEHADCLFDEVAGVSDASESGSIPVQVINWLHTLRKSDVRLRVTTPAYSRCSKPVRQVVQVVVDARSFFPEARVEGRLWRPRQGFMFTAYDAFSFEDFTSGSRERLQSMGRAVLWRPGHEAERRYDTLGQVLALGHVDEHGLCSICGGSRSRPKCACDPHLCSDSEVVVVETVSAGGARVRTGKTQEQLDAEAAAAVDGPPARQARQRRSAGVSPAVGASPPEAPAPSLGAVEDLPA